MEIRRNLCLPVIILAIVSGSGVVLPSEPVWAQQANSQADSGSRPLGFSAGIARAAGLGIDGLTPILRHPDILGAEAAAHRVCRLLSVGVTGLEPVTSAV